MEGQGNCVRVTRLAKKREAEAMVKHLQQPNKKRVVLAEIQDLSNVGINQIKPKTKQITTKRKVKRCVNEKDKEFDDPQMCSAYVSDIYDCLHHMEIEKKRKPLLDYLEKIQKDVTANMRGVLVDWLVEVAEEYKLLVDTLYLTVSYIDRFLSVNVIPRQRLQLLGVSAMLIAVKYEEISPPNVEDFCYITDNKFTKKEVVNMEASVLQSLKFEMGNPTTKTFLRRFTRVAQEDHKSRFAVGVSRLLPRRVKFIGLQLREILAFFGSCCYDIPFKVHITAKVTSLGYKVADLKECVLIIHDLQLSRKGSTLSAVKNKYKLHKFKCASTLSSPLEIPDSLFKDTIQ